MDGHRLKVEGYEKSQDRASKGFHTQSSFLKVTPKVSLRIVETSEHTPKSNFKLHPLTEQALKEKKTKTVLDVPKQSNNNATLKSTTTLAQTLSPLKQKTLFRNSMSIKPGGPSKENRVKTLFAMALRNMYLKHEAKFFQRKAKDIREQRRTINFFHEISKNIKKYSLRHGYYQSTTIHSGRSKISGSGAMTTKSSVFKALP